jgi:hypothetical protein
VASSEHLFVILNKSDIAGESLPEVLEFTKAAIKEVVAERHAVCVVPMSATRARQAQRGGGEDAAFGDFVRSLRRFVDEHGDATRERSIRRRAAALLHRLDALVTMRISALKLPKAERHRCRQLVEHALQTVQDQARSLELVIDDDVRQTRAALEAATNHFYERDEISARSFAAEFAAEHSRQRRNERLEQTVAKVATRWRKDAIDLVSRRLRSDAAKYGRLLGEMEASALDAGCIALNIGALPLTARDVEFEPWVLTQISALTPTTGLELIVAVAIEFLPRPIRASILRRRYEDMMAQALDALRGKLRYAISHDIEPWRRGARVTITSAIENVRRAVLSAFADVDEADTSEEQDLGYALRLQRELADIEASIKNEQLASGGLEAKMSGSIAGR